MFPLDLSKATKLKDLTFLCSSSNVRWVTTALQTVESKHFHHIAIHPYAAVFRSPPEETVHSTWQDLDQLLVRFWTSHSIRIRLVYWPDGGGTRDHASSLLPELIRRGLIDLVEHNPAPGTRIRMW